MSLHQSTVDEESFESPSLKLTDSSVSTPSLPPSTPVSSNHTVMSIATELSNLNLHFEKTPETTVDICVSNLRSILGSSILISNVFMQKREELKQCIITISHFNHVAVLEITLPPNYPKTQSPIFKFGTRSTIDSVTRKELTKVLKTAAASDLKKKKNCLDHCIKIFVTQLKALLVSYPCFLNGGIFMFQIFQTEERTNDSSKILNTTPQVYGGQQDYSIPFPRTSGARFCGSGVLVCFTRPTQVRHVSQRPARAEPSTPRSLSALNALTNNLSVNTKYSNYYSGGNADKNISVSMYFHQDNNSSRVNINCSFPYHHKYSRLFLET